MDANPNERDYLQEAVRLAQQLLVLADEGEAHATEDTCRIVFGVIRDCAYKVTIEANEERCAHARHGSQDTQEHAAN